MFSLQTSAFDLHSYQVGWLQLVSPAMKNSESESPGSNVRPTAFKIVMDPTEERSGERKEREKGMIYELFISL